MCRRSRSRFFRRAKGDRNIPVRLGDLLPKAECRPIRARSAGRIARFAEVDGGKTRRRGWQQHQLSQKAGIARKRKTRRQAETLCCWLIGETCPMPLLLFES